MSNRFVFVSASSVLAIVAASAAQAEPVAQEPSSFVATAVSPIDMNSSAWSVDRSAPAGFERTTWQDRDSLKVSIAPPSTPISSYYSWQGYSQRLDTPAGAANISGDLWIDAAWESGGSSDYIRTSIWGAVLPEGSPSYVDSQAIFPIISFTNQDGDARFQVWDVTTGGGWVDLPESAGAVLLGEWNNLEMRVLPASDTIEYVVNGTVIYTWEQPRGDTNNTSNELWAVYLNARNNASTSFDTYWSDLHSGSLFANGDVITSAPDGIRILEYGVGAVSVADDTTVGSITTGQDSAVRLSFGARSGVETSANDTPGVVSDQGATLNVVDGSVVTTGASSHGLFAKGADSGLVIDGTVVAVSGASSFGASAANGGSITINGGAVSTSGIYAYGLRADGAGSVITSSADVATATDWSFGAYATNGAVINLSSGTVTTDAFRAHGLLAETGGTITSGAAIETNGDRAHGVQAVGGTINLNGGSVTTDGASAYGMLASNGGTIASAADITTTGNGSFGVSADGNGTVMLNGGDIVTSGAGSHGLIAVRDARFANAGNLTASAVSVATSGSNAFGVIASEGGSVVLTDASVETTGAGSHGLYVSGLAYVSTLTAENSAITASGAGAVVQGSANVTLTDSTLDSAGPAFQIIARNGSAANLSVVGGTVASGSDVLLAVDRSSDVDGTGIANLNLSGGAVATGGVTGINLLSLNDATWNITAETHAASVVVGPDGATINADADSIVFDQFTIDNGVATLNALSGGVNVGSFTKLGAGALNLAGAGSALGDITVNGGLLAVNTTLDGNITVNSGAVLGGRGTINNLFVRSGATLAPGNSIDTLNVVGDVTFAAGSTFEVEVDAAGNGDKVVAGGVAHLNGANVSVLAAPGDYLPSTAYTILTATGGIDGRFAGNVAINSLFLDAALQYGTNNVVLTLNRNNMAFAAVAQTPNQISVATALGGAPLSSNIVRAVANISDAAVARHAYDLLSGEVWASTGTAIIDKTRRANELVLGRLQQADDVTRWLAGQDDASTAALGQGLAIWGQATGSWNKIDGDGNAAHVNQNDYGFITGVDGTVGQWRLGAAFAHGETDLNVAERASRSEVNSNLVEAYVGGGWGNVRLHLGASYGWHDVKGTRSVAFSTFSETLTGNYDAETISGFGEVSYAAYLGAARVEPFAGVNYVHMKSDDFVETNGTTAALAVGQVKRDVTYSTLGLRAGADLPITPAAVVRPHVSAAWQHAFGDRDAVGLNALNVGPAFAVEGIAVAKDALAMEAGLESNIIPGGTLGISYVGNVADNWDDHGLKLGFSYSF